MRPPPRGAVTALILAGGRGRRFGGRDKSGLLCAGRPLIHHLLKRLRAEAACVLVAADRRPAALRAPAVRVIHDRHPRGSGPLAGLAAGLAAARTPWLLCCPVDGVAPPRDLRRRLGRRPGAYLQSPSGPHYLHLMMRRRDRTRLDSFRDDGGRAAANAIAALGLEAVMAPDRGCSYSVNAQHELRRLRRRRLGQPGSRLR